MLDILCEWFSTQMINRNVKHYFLRKKNKKQKKQKKKTYFRMSSAKRLFVIKLADN